MEHHVMNPVFLLISMFLYFPCLSTFSQNGIIQKQINTQVWKPFIEGFNAGDAEKIMHVQSKDVTRILQDNNKIYDYNRYYEVVKEGAKNNFPRKWKANIELRFSQRIASNNRAFEVGYYKTISTTISDGKSRVSFGEFHVLLRKENGTWKIMMDADAHQQIDEETFLIGKPMEN